MASAANSLGQYLLALIAYMICANKERGYRSSVENAIPLGRPQYRAPKGPVTANSLGKVRQPHVPSYLTINNIYQHIRYFAVFVLSLPAYTV
jgi:hypothetical protein